MNGQKRLRVYAGGAVLAAGTLWACWWWLSSEYSPLLYNPPPPSRPAAPVRRAPVAAAPTGRPRPLPSDPDALLKRLNAGADQPGIVVCEPVARGADGTTARFGTGCSRWLSFALGGVPALGSTPSWDTIATVLPTTSRRDLRLTAEQSRQLAGPLGVNYAAVGEISGTPARAVLTYRMCEIPSGNAKGGPSTVTGTLEEITGKLPEVAAGMLRAANVPATRVGEGLTETASTLTALGAYPWRAEAGVPRDLEKLTYRSRLASAVILSRADVWDMPQVAEIQHSLVEQFPGHPLALQMATLCADAKPDQGNSALRAVIRDGEQIIRQYPYSCLTQMALSAAYWRTSRLDDARDAAEAAVVSCNRSAEAWSLLATLTDVLAANAATTADEAELARTTAQLNGTQSGSVGGNLPRQGPAAPVGNAPAPTGGRTADQDAWYRGVLLRRQVAPLFRRAVALDDRRWDIWRNYCSAATRDSDWTTAGAAFWKAAPRCAGDSDTIHAGLDLWGQWHPQPNEFRRVVDYALAHPSASEFQRLRLVAYFTEHGLGAEARRVAQTTRRFLTAGAEVTRRTSQPERQKAVFVPPIRTPPPADLPRQKIAGPWLIGKAGGWLTRLTWSPDGRTLAMADERTGPVVWRGGTSVRRLGGAPQAPMADVAWTPSGELVAAMRDARLVYWNVADGQVLRTVPRPRGTSARSVAIRPSGDRIVYRDEQRIYSLFSLPDQRHIPMRTATVGERPDAAFSPDGALLATIVTTNGGAELLLRSPEDGRELHRIEPPGNVEEMAWRPDGKAIAVSVSDDTVRVYDTEGKELTSRHVHDRPICMAWGPGGKLLAFGTSEGVVQTWNPATGETRQSRRGHKDRVELLAWDLHGDRIATWGNDGALLLWNPHALPPAPALQEPPPAETTVLSAWTSVPVQEHPYAEDLAFTPDARLVTAASPTEANVYEVGSGRTVQQFKPGPGAGLQQLFLSPDGKSAFGYGFSEVWAWDRATTQPKWTRKLPQRVISVGPYQRNTAALSPDGRWLAAAMSAGNGLHVLDTATGQDAKLLTVCGTPYALRYSPDGKWLAVAYGSDARWADIDLYDAHTFAPLATFSGHRDKIIELCFSPDGSTLASLGEDRTVRVWSVASRKPVRALPVLATQQGTLAFPAGGRRLLAQSGIQIRVWDLPTGRLLRDVSLKKENLSTLTFSADGKLAANQVLNNLREQKRSLQVWRVAE